MKNLIFILMSFILFACDKQEPEPVINDFLLAPGYYEIESLESIAIGETSGPSTESNLKSWIHDQESLDVLTNYWAGTYDQVTSQSNTIIQDYFIIEITQVDSIRTYTYKLED